MPSAGSTSKATAANPSFDDVDLSRTVGWFTSIFPVRLRTEPQADIGAALASMQQQLQAIPGRGIGYGMLLHLRRPAGCALHCRPLPPRELSFNYLGQFDQRRRGRVGDPWCARIGRTERDPAAPRGLLIEVEGSVSGGGLRIDWAYSLARHAAATIERLAADFNDQLAARFDPRRPQRSGPIAAARFGDAGIDTEEMARLLATLSDSTAEPPDTNPGPSHERRAHRRHRRTLAAAAAAWCFDALAEPGAPAYLSR